MMKKSIFIAAATAIVAVSCARADLETEIVAQDVPEGDIVCSFVPETRTVLSSGMRVAWEKDDKILLAGEDGRQRSEYSIKEISPDSFTAVFSSPDPVVSGVRYAFYPASSFKSMTENDGKILARVDLSSLGGTEAGSGYASDGTLPEGADVSGLPMTAVSEGSLFAFRNLCGGLVIRPYDYQRTGIAIVSVAVRSLDGYGIGSSAIVDVETGTAVSFEGDNDSVQLKLSTPVVLDSGGWTSWSSHQSSSFVSSAKAFYAYLPCGSYPSGFEVSLTDSEGRTYSFETEGIEIAPGIFHRLAYIPLTLYYGSENSVRVDPGSTSVQIDITPGYSFNSDFTRSGRTVSYAEEPVFSAQVLWQQEYGCPGADLSSSSSRGTVIPGGSSPSISGNILTVPLTGTAGNALVALKNQEGETLWSWHIWVGEASEVECITSTGGNCVLMDRNIGATSALNLSQTTQELVRNSFGLMYQWGRKDPFPRVVTRSVRVTTYKAGLALTTSVQRSAEIGNIAWSIANPDKRIWLSGGCNWLLSYINELWGFPYAAGEVDRLVSENQSREGVKTAYDPCPEGWRVADIKHLKGLADDNAGKLSGRDTYYGYMFSTGPSVTYIPASGWALSSEGDDTAMAYEGYWGMLWSSACNVSNTPYFYTSATSSATFNVCVRGHLCPVRCQKI